MEPNCIHLSPLTSILTTSYIKITLLWMMLWELTIKLCLGKISAAKFGIHVTWSRSLFWFLFRLEGAFVWNIHLIHTEKCLQCILVVHQSARLVFGLKLFVGVCFTVILILSRAEVTGCHVKTNTYSRLHLLLIEGTSKAKDQQTISADNFFSFCCESNRSCLL